jgi:HD-GYP domain-containing protein (c-di-GMP phosphodiesterase class II)
VYAVKQNGIDFSGPRRYDSITGYHTKSMLVVPLEDNNGDIIGVLQLLNAQDERGRIIPFAPYIEQVVCSIASQAAVAIINMRYVNELDEMLHAFVRVISTAIDERSPYNANHTRNMTRRAGKFACYLKKREITADLSDEAIEQLIMSAWLHDIGKIAIPLEIMDKPTRLSGHEELVRYRLMTIREQRKVQLIKKAMKENQLQTPAGIAAFWKDVADIEADMDAVNDFLAVVNNPATVVDAKMQQKIKELAARTWVNADGKEQLWLLPSEVEELMIPSGTLTENERQTIESHVGITRKMLDQIPFGAKYYPVPGWACSHHEFLDGSGYPRKLKADELPLPVRILTIMDIYDALTACDRPYRRALPPERAFAILDEMAGAGKLDKELVGCFKESKIWAE